jgi:sugar phosphate isomerase/epimerase
MEKSVDEARNLLLERNLTLGNFGLPVEFRKDEDTFRRELKRLPELVELSRAMGVDRCCTWLYPATDDPVAEYTSRFIRRLRECAKVLNAYDILALSPDQIVLVHINDAPDLPPDEQIDNQRLLPGEGIIPLQDMLGALGEVKRKT